jgi:methyltransferase-like protein/trans-aconitate methyltransferase
MSNADAPTTSYDEVPYPGGAYPASHPARLVAISKLFGLTPPDMDTARVLEIGCSFGKNIIPLADVYPRAKFLGIDLSERQIQEGRETIHSIGLDNIELCAVDLREFRREEKFDFILVHGVYSWITPETQAKLLEVVKSHLSEEGIAYISYNTLPGWRMRGMIRDMMLRHARRFTTAADKIGQARALLAFLAEAAQDERSPYAQFLKSELELLRMFDDSYLYHEHLEKENNPVYFQDFVESAAAAGLGYLADSDVRLMVTNDLHPAAKRLLDAAGSLLDVEQYIDFVRNRMFRMSLLVHKGRRPNYRISSFRIVDFQIASQLQPTGPIGDLLSTEEVDFRSGPASIRTSQVIVKAAFQALAQACPCALPFAELLAQTFALLNQPLPTPGPTLDRMVDALGETLLRAYTSLPLGVVELFVQSLPMVSQPGEKPRAPRAARRFAATRHVSNLRHQPVRLSDVQACILPKLNGENDRQVLMQVLEEAVENQVLQLRENDAPVTDKDHARALIRLRLDADLAGLARAALLVE